MSQLLSNWLVGSVLVIKTKGHKFQLNIYMTHQIVDMTETKLKITFAKI